MMFILKKAVAYLKAKTIKAKWYVDYYTFKPLIRSEKPFFTDREHILILAPHSDDEWVGCSRLLINSHCIICNMNMPGGDSQDVHELRLKEMADVAEKYKVSFVSVNEDQSQTIRKLIEENSITIIAIPFFFDWHYEHIKVIELLKEAIDELNRDIKITMYQVSYPIPEKAITQYYSLKKEDWEKKWSNFVLYYPTQKMIPFRRFAQNERINGKLFNKYAAEVYCTRNLEQWCREWKEICNKIQFRNDIQTNLNDLSKVRDIVNSFYETMNGEEKHEDIKHITKCSL